LYVFALTREACPPFQSAGHAVEFVRAGDVYAAVERAVRPPSVSEPALRRQHDVIAALTARVDAVLPARFGAFVDGPELEAIVTRRRDVITEALQLVRGRKQMTSRLLGSESGAETGGPGTAVAAESGTAYMESRRQRHARPAPLSAVAEAVRDLVAAERFEVGRGRTIATLYHLIDARDVKAYRDALVTVQVRTEDGTLTLTGPWAPFAFAPDLWT
jgi:hypothetical protein